jgi:hypothetical protein
VIVAGDAVLVLDDELHGGEEDIKRENLGDSANALDRFSGNGMFYHFTNVVGIREPRDWVAFISGAADHECCNTEMRNRGCATRAVRVENNESLGVGVGWFGEGGRLVG